MNADQKLIATIGLGLLAIVIFTSYKPYLEAIILGSPNTSSGGSKSASPSNGVGGWLNPLNWGTAIGQHLAQNANSSHVPSNSGAAGTTNPAQTTILA